MVCTLLSGISLGLAPRSCSTFSSLRKSEVEGIVRSVNGFVAYTLIRTAEGGASITVCQDKAGADESSRLAREWIAKNASDLGVSPPGVAEGSVILQLK